MKPALLTAVFLVGCGARIEGEVDDAGAKAAVIVDTGTSTPPGCPTLKPESGASCIASSGVPDEHFYCHYFAGESACAAEHKCTQHDGTGAPAHIYGFGEDCTFVAGDCAEGKTCGRVFENDGACIVACKRACRCDRATGTLKCTPIACGP